MTDEERRRLDEEAAAREQEDTPAGNPLDRLMEIVAETKTAGGEADSPDEGRGYLPGQGMPVEAALGSDAAGVQLQRELQPAEAVPIPSGEAGPSRGSLPQAGAPAAPAIGQEQIRQALVRLQDYSEKKRSVDERIIDDEEFWKMKPWEHKATHEEITPTAWLWNVIMSKHADMMDSYPEPNVRPKEKGDVQEAEMLSSIVPVILEENGFKQTWSDGCRVKLGSGTAIYAVTWDGKKHGGLGDVSITETDVLNLFWEPGISNIQQSKEVFHVCPVDKELLEMQYPELKGRVGSSALTIKEYIYDDTVDKEKKALVVDWYYKKIVNGKTVLHYCKFVNEHILYATENQTERPTAPVRDPMTGEQLLDEYTGEPLTQEIGQSMAERGFYDHGKFPFVLDTLFKVKGSPCGYGYIDICKGTQQDIDILNHAIVKNAMLAARPRFFRNTSGSVNIEQFADYSNDFVDCESNLGEDSLRQIEVPALPQNCIEILNNKIEELKETSGNRDVNNGQTQSGVTAASAIAALQESAGKTSRDMIAASYEAFKEITYFVIELIRQFYDTKRQFRIVGQDGQDQFVSYSNQNIVPQQQGQMFGNDMGLRVPEFDIEVSAQKATPYSKMSQNELGLQFFQLGFFNPQGADQAAAALQMMDFNHKSDVMQIVQRNGTMFENLQQLLQVAMGLATRYEPQVAQSLAAQFQNYGGQQMFQAASAATAEIAEQAADGTIKPEEHPFVKKARQSAQEATQVTG